MSPPRTPAPPASVKDLTEQLVRHGLLGPAEGVELARAWPPDTQTGPFLDALERGGLLTPWQASQVRQGKVRHLRLGPYLLIEPLATGGMGRVYRARHVHLKRTVAVKVIGRSRPSREREAGPSSVRLVGARGRRLRRELEAAGKLSHPNIVLTHDAGRARGRVYLVMEYVEGRDLQKILDEEGPLPVRQALDVLRQAALALEHLHGLGWVHRDVKPANLLRTPGGVVKLLDLGLACPADGDGEDELAGTPDYLAPERGLGGPADPRGDLYGLGCTLYHLLTGSVPFPGGSWSAKLLRHQLESPVPLRERRPDVPDRLAHLVGWLMAREPGARPASARALLDALDAAEVEQSAPPRSTPQRRLRPRSVLAACLVGLLVGGSARQAVHEPAGRGPAVSAPAGLVEVEGQPAPFAGLAEAVAAAPDGGVVILHGPGPFRTVGLHLLGKALTLRAAPGERARLEGIPTPDRPWQPLLGGARALRLEGLHLSSPGDELSALVYQEGGELVLEDTHLESSSPAPLVVARQGASLGLRGCHLHAAGVAVSVEVAGPSCRVEVDRCSLSTTEGAALSLWCSEGSAAGRCAVALTSCSVRAARAVSARGLAGPLEVRAQECSFRCRECVLCLDGCGPQLRWQGRRNRYACGAWVCSDGLSVTPGEWFDPGQEE